MEDVQRRIQSSKFLSLGSPQPKTLTAALVLTSETEVGCRGDGAVRWQLSDGLQEVLLDNSLMISSDALSEEAAQCWTGPREMPQEAHAGEKKRKL